MCLAGNGTAGSGGLRKSLFIVDWSRIRRILQDNSNLTQRELVEMFRMSVGGLNYCLNALH